MGSQVFNIPRVAAASQPLVFQEQFTGNGADTTFQLTGAVLNATFQIGAWDPSDLIITHLGDITNTSGKALYDSAIPFTRHRISIVSVNSSGLVTLDYAPRVENFYIYYWYQPKASDRLSDYLRDDVVSRVEETDPMIASSIQVDTTNFGTNLGPADSDVQSALETLDDLTAGDLDAYTMDEVDALVAALHLEYFFKNTASSDISGYLQLTPTETTTALDTITTGAYAAGNDQLITELRFATEPGQPNLSELLAGIYEVHLHLSVSSVLTKTTLVYAILYERKADNSEVVVTTSEVSEVLLTTVTEQGIHLALSSNYPLAATTSRLVIKFYANISGGGSSVTIAFGTADATSTGISIPTNITALDNRYAAKPHSITSTADHTFPGGGTTFLRDDGTFQAAGGGTPSDTVEAETSFDLTPDAGASATYSRGDHTHGTPASDVVPLRITTAINFYIRTDGDDGNDGSANDAGHAWLTLAYAFSFLQAYILQAAVTIFVNDGVYESNNVNCVHQQGNNITIKGVNSYAKTMSSVQSSSGGAGAWSVIINLNNVTDITTSDYALIYGASGGTNPNRIVGCWDITNVDAVNNRITVTTTNITGAPSGAVAASVIINKTYFQVTGVAGTSALRCFGAGFTVSLSKATVLSDGSAEHYGIAAISGGSFTLAGTDLVGINGFDSGTGSKGIRVDGYPSFFQAGSGVVIGNCYYGVFIQLGAALSIGSVNTAINGCTYGLFASQFCSASAGNCVINGCTNGMRGQRMAYIFAVSATVADCTTALSPAANTVANDNAYMDT